MHKRDIPQDRFKDATSIKCVCDFCPTKVYPNRTKLTVRGNIINYPGYCETPTANMLLVQMLVNSVISTIGPKFMTVDINKIYLNTP